MTASTRPTKAFLYLLRALLLPWNAILEPKAWGSHGNSLAMQNFMPYYKFPG